MGQRRTRREPAWRVPLTPQMDARKPSLPHRRLPQRVPRTGGRLLRLVYEWLPMGQRPHRLHRRNPKNALPRRLEAPAAPRAIRRQRQLRHSLRRRHVVPPRARIQLRRPHRITHLRRQTQNAILERLRRGQLFPGFGIRECALEGAAELGWTGGGCVEYVYDGP